FVELATAVIDESCISEGGTSHHRAQSHAASYTLSGRGKGGLLGLAEGSADVSLADDGADTILTFTANGGASGQIMKMGKAIIGNSAQRIIDGFFERFGTAAGVEVTPLPRDNP
ncbi:MAG: hypothetical protein EOP20_05560, partial [Hyphomicrobiales bacterium]